GAAHPDVDPVPGRTTGAEPDTGGGHHGHRDEHQRDTVPPVRRVDLLGPADRPDQFADAAGQQAAGATGGRPPGGPLAGATRLGPWPRPGPAPAPAAAAPGG